MTRLQYRNIKEKIVVILIDLKKIVLYAFLIGKIKDFGIRIIFRFKNTFLKKKIAEIISFHGKVRWSVNCNYFSQFKMKAKEILEKIIYTILKL